jgi:hypothetical protein
MTGKETQEQFLPECKQAWALRVAGHEVKLEQDGSCRPEAAAEAYSALSLYPSIPTPSPGPHPRVSSVCSG